MKVYHGTTLENAIRIMDEGFKIQQNEVTNDLGAGLYTYCDDELGIWKPQKNALRYARQYKNGKHCVIDLTIDDDLVKDGYLDLNDPEMTIQWEKIRNLLQSRANDKWKTFTHGKAKKRHNLDGIILEAALKSGMFSSNCKSIVNPNFTVKCTYTSFIPHTISNFPNGRELVIRNLGIVKTIEIKEA